MPKLNIEIQLEEGQIPIMKKVTIPFTWLHFMHEHEVTNKKSRIKTKICLEGLNFNPKRLKLMGRVFQGWVKRSNTSAAHFETHFTVGDSEFELGMTERGDRLGLELQGKGEDRLTHMIELLAQLIC